MARNDYSRRSSKDVFWGDDDNNKKGSKSDELEELFKQSEALEQQKEQAPPPHAPAYEPSYETDSSYEPSYETEFKMDSAPSYESSFESSIEPETPSYESEFKMDSEPTHDYDNLFEPKPEPEPELAEDVDNPYFDYDSLLVNDTEAQDDDQSEEYAQDDESEQLEEQFDATEQPIQTPPPYEPRNIAPPPYIPSQNRQTTTPPAKRQEDILDGFDVEKFIKDNDTNFNMTIFAKVFSQGFGVFLLLKWLFYDFEKWWLVLIMAFIGFGLIMYIFGNSYEKYINQALKSIKRVISYNKNPKNTIPWGSMIVFPHSEVSATKEDELIVVADETKVTSQEFLFERKVGKNDKETLMMCECYSADMDGRTSFADNIVLAKGKMPYARHAKFRQPVSQYVLHFDDQNCLDECNTPRLLALADSVSAHLGNKPFVMAFSSTNINLAVPIDHLDKFDYNFFDYTIADRIRRDITATVNRVQVANLLAEN